MHKIRRFDPADLMKEGSLTEIYTNLRKEVKEQRFNIVAGLLWSITVATSAWLSKPDLASLAQTTRSLVELGLNFATSILGFLLAGFTIFATMSKADLTTSLASHSEEEGGSSYLKLGYFSFIEVFIDYLFFVSLCLFIRILSSPGGGVSEIVGQIDGSGAAKVWLCKATYWFTASAFGWIVLKLKSFIYNVYHFAMVSVRWETEKHVVAEADEYVDIVLKYAEKDSFLISDPLPTVNESALIEAFDQRGYSASIDVKDQMRVERKSDTDESM